MKLIDVPVYNNAGELQFTAAITPDEAQHLLQFAINFKLAMASTMSLAVPVEEPEATERHLDD